MHSALLLTPVLVFLPLLVLSVPVIVRLLRPCRMSELTPEWLESFEASSYSPMQGLLAAEDFQFLSRQPGFDISMCRKLRRERMVIFRQYLNRLIADFNRLHRLSVFMVSQSDKDNSELFVRLLKIRVRFSLAVLQVEFSYACCKLGMRSLHVASLLERFDEMSAQLTGLSKSPLPI